MKKYGIFFLMWFCVFMLVVILPLTKCNEKTTKKYHDFLTSNTFLQQTRTEQIKKCASCHKKEYENEQKGPHAFSYKSITEHKNFVNSEKYDCDFYTQHVNRSFNDCLGCHTPQNLYETLLNDSIQPQLIAANLLKEAHPSPLTRVNSKSTGIDCMSCHFDGKKIISLKHISSVNDTAIAKQTLNQITVNNLNCFLCHADVVRNFNPAIAIKNTGSALCINCHQEFDRNKKGTHYFFWQHDMNDKHNPKPNLLMNDFHFSISNNKKEGIITWQNTVAPHKISPGPEIVLFCDVLDQDSSVLGSKTIRINKKKEFDKEMYQTMGNRNQLGILGDDIPLDGKPVIYKIPLKNVENAAFFRMAYMHKSQYWFPDSLGTKGLVKIQKINTSKLLN